MMVLMPTVNYVGVSRRIEDEEERARLKEIMEGIKPNNMGLIVRTAVVGKNPQDFENEISFLSRLWERIMSRSEYLRAPRLLHAEESLVFRTVRDLFTADVSEFVINDHEYFDKVVAVAGIIAPHLKERVRLYTEGINIFDDFGIQVASTRRWKKGVDEEWRVYHHRRNRSFDRC